MSLEALATCSTQFRRGPGDMIMLFIFLFLRAHNVKNRLLGFEFVDAASQFEIREIH